MESEDNELQANETAGEPIPEAQPAEESAPDTEPTVALRDFSEWHGKDLIDSAGERIGKLEDVYFDVETDQPQFATVKEGLFGRHLTFVPLTDIILGPNDLQVSVPAQLHTIRNTKRPPPRKTLTEVAARDAGRGASWKTAAVVLAAAAPTSGVVVMSGPEQATPGGSGAAGEHRARRPDVGMTL